MDYEGRICRTPMERGSFMLPVQVGCSYNKCKFCMLFKHLKFRILPTEQIEAELLRVKSLNGSPSTVFLGDGNAFSLGFEKLSQIISLIHKYFPACDRINMDATISSIANMTDDQLADLSKQGVRCLYIGIESGLDDVLVFMSKDHNVSEAETQINRLHAAGIQFGAHIMTGIAGEGRGTENAEATAAFLNKMHPASITNFSMFTEKRAPIWDCVENGTYKPASVQESMVEELLLLELLEVSCPYEGFQDFIKHRTYGTLPEDKEKMLGILRNKIDEYQNRELLYPCVDVEPGECACQYTQESVCSDELPLQSHLVSSWHKVKTQYEIFKKEVNGASKYYVAATDSIDEFLLYEEEWLPHSDEYYDSLILAKRAVSAFITHQEQQKESSKKIGQSKTLLNVLESIPDNENDEQPKIKAALKRIADINTDKALEAKLAEESRIIEEKKTEEQRIADETAYFDQLKKELPNYLADVEECDPRRVVSSDEFRTAKNALYDTVKFFKKHKHGPYSEKDFSQARDALQSIADFAEIYLAKKAAEQDSSPLAVKRIAAMDKLYSFAVNNVKELNRKLKQSDITCAAAAKVLLKKSTAVLSEELKEAIFDIANVRNALAAIIYARELEQMPATKLYNKEMAIKALSALAKSDTVREMTKSRVTIEEYEDYID